MIILKVLLINSDDGPDYLADLINYFFITNNYEVYTNHKSKFLFEDYKDINNLYGKGFTLYGKLSTELSNNVTELTVPQIIDSINRYELIIFTSIQRKYKSKAIREDLFFKIKQKTSDLNIIVIDGEDHVSLDQNIALTSSYFKRELISKNKNFANPISFAFPKFEIANNDVKFQNKTQLLAPMDPRFQNSYIYKSEFDYFDQYKKSLFAVTTKKAGWDCMRHYEILASNTLPFFPDIDQKPELTMATYPTKLQIKVNGIFAKLISSDENIDSLEEIRLKYPSKNYFSRGIKKTKRKLSSLNIIENNIHRLNETNQEFQEWFENFGTTQSYKRLFKL